MPIINTIEEMRDLWCEVDELTDCWLWKGYTAKSGTPWVTTPGVDGGRRQIVQAYRVAWQLAGRSIKPGQSLTRLPHCTHASCVNPFHRKVGTVKDAMMAAAKRGTLSTPERVATLKSVLRKQAIPMEVFREAEERLGRGEMVRDVAKATGVHEDTISKIRRGVHFHQSGGCGHSVFSWRP